MKVVISILFVFLSGYSIAQEDVLKAVNRFTRYVIDNEKDSALSMCTEFGKANYFENKKHFKFCRFEFFKDMHNLNIAESRKNEVRVTFRSGKDSTAREVYAKQYGDEWKIITKIELVNIKSYYLSVKTDSAVIHRGWNTGSARHVDIPFAMHLLYNSEDLFILGVQIDEDLKAKIMEGQNVKGTEISMVLIKGNVLPLVIEDRHRGKAIIKEVKHKPEELSLKSYVIEGEFTGASGHDGSFRMKIILDE